ncbi:MAG: 16S rRNA (uracil(1498)-N(3))-methyltransferase [Treponema sp.]|jgi:16S rRNA (uracil1498-N3)-methyltransferase|nr:16S rRNA (uracil(1498)-N(3))-methyltransferase [Treponema sp.]
MKHFILNNEPDSDGIIRLEGKNYRYLIRTRRLAVGEFFPALLPCGKETLIKILSTGNNLLIGKCEEEKSLDNGLFCKSGIPPIILLQALPKGDKMDLIVRQAAESGISQIIPFVSEFSIGKANVGEKKFSRWERIVKEARQQSGSKVSTALHFPLTINEVFDYWGKINKDGALGLLFHHQGVEKISLHRYLKDDSKIIVMAIGPEGGFSETEVSQFLENGFKALTIGDTVLRTETAALYCAAAIKIILLEKDAWELNKV